MTEYEFFLLVIIIFNILFVIITAAYDLISYQKIIINKIDPDIHICKEFATFVHTEKLIYKSND